MAADRVTVLASPVEWRPFDGTEWLQGGGATVSHVKLFLHSPSPPFPLLPISFTPTLFFSDRVQPPYPDQEYSPSSHLVNTCVGQDISPIFFLNFENDKNGEKKKSINASPSHLSSKDSQEQPIKPHRTSGENHTTKLSSRKAVLISKSLL